MAEQPYTEAYPHPYPYPHDQYDQYDHEQGPLSHGNQGGGNEDPGTLFEDAFTFDVSPGDVSATVA